MTTFNVDSVKIEQTHLVTERTNKLWHEHYLKEELARVGIKEAEANCFNYEVDRDFELVRPDVNSFIYTVLRAYNDHVPLTLAPDDIWILVVQAVAKHIELNPEDCRKAIVNFEGKKTLHVEANDFVKGSPKNDWPRVFNQFGDQIETHLGKKRPLFDPTFSTTTSIEKTAIQVQMMAALAPFFKYTMSTLCGIPNVTLLGTKEDWNGIVDRVSAFGEFFPSWALEPLLYAVRNFASAAANNQDLEFWRNFAKRDGGSGGPYISGFINCFFPYLQDQPSHMLKPNKGTFMDAIVGKSGRMGNGPKQTSFPGAVTGAPLEWKYYSETISMQLASGIFGMTTYGAGYRPVIGWVVGKEREIQSDAEASEVRREAWKNHNVYED